MKNAVNAPARRRPKANELVPFAVCLAENILTQICANNARQSVTVLVCVCACVSSVSCVSVCVPLERITAACQSC